MFMDSFTNKTRASSYWNAWAFLRISHPSLQRSHPSSRGIYQNMPWRLRFLGLWCFFQFPLLKYGAQLWSLWKGSINFEPFTYWSYWLVVAFVMAKKNPFMSGAMTVYLAFGNRTYRNGPFHGTMASVMGWFKYKECSIRYGIQWQLQIIWMWVSIGKIIKLNLVGGWPTPLKDMTSSVGMMTFPYIMENHKCHVPKHQSVI